MTKAFARLLFIAALCWSSCESTLACSCSLLSAHDRYQNADVVFVGDAVSKTKDGMVFKIEESFWGTEGGSITVKQYDPIICDSFAFEAGHKYLVVAYRLQGELTVGSCNQGAGIAYAAGDIRALHAKHEGKPLPYVYGVVLSKTGVPSANAPVTLRSQASPNSLVLQTKTADDGYFEFRSVPPGEYRVVVNTKPGGHAIKAYFASGKPGVRLIMHEW